MAKIRLNYQDRNFFHPRPSKRMEETIIVMLPKLGWEIERPAEELTREEAKQLIGKGIKALKRRKIRLFETEIDFVNKELTAI